MHSPRPARAGKGGILTATELKPVYVLHGDDGFLRDACRERIVEGVIRQGADPQMCVTTFDASAELADVLDELRTLPFLAPCRVVILRDADEFVKAHRSAVEEYLQHPCPTSVLVLMVSSWPGNWRLAKLVGKIGEKMDCSVPEGENLSPWLNKAAARRGKRIDPDAADLLAEWVPRSLAALDGEIEKLCLYVGDRDAITMEDVGALVTATAGPAAYGLTNAITAGDARGALKALDGMLTARGEEFRTLGMIAWHLRRALQAQQRIQAGATPRQAVGTLRMPYRQQAAFVAFLQRRSPRALRADFRSMIRADLAMKSGTDPKAALQELVVRLCS